jgi:hypothetical protein
MYQIFLRNIGISNNRTFDNLVAHEFRNFYKIATYRTLANSWYKLRGSAPALSPSAWLLYLPAIAARITEAILNFASR